MKNQLELILENIRLAHIEKLLTEATSEQEVAHGIELINESMQKLYGILVEDGWADVSGGTWADEVKKPMRRASDQIGHVSDSVDHTSVEKIPGEPAVIKPTGVVLGKPKSTGLGASRWK